MMIKPSDFDISFKYICEQCKASHWLFYREAKTKGFKIVCECSNVFEPSTIKKIDILYEENIKDNKDDMSIIDKSLSVNSINVCLNTLENLGYTKNESMKMIYESFDVLQSDDCNAIIKHAISNIGGQLCQIQ